MMKIFAQPNNGARGKNGASGKTQRTINANTGVYRVQRNKAARDSRRADAYAAFSKLPRQRGTRAR